MVSSRPFVFVSDYVHVSGQGISEKFMYIKLSKNVMPLEVIVHF
jgi:hypothetical protein